MRTSAVIILQNKDSKVLTGQPVELTEVTSGCLKN